MSAHCTCGHGMHTHVAFLGGCGLCDCVAYRNAPLDFTITRTSHTKEEP